MNLIISKLLTVLGWQRLVIMVWNTVKPLALEASKKTETKFDENVIEFTDEIIKAITAK